MAIGQLPHWAAGEPTESTKGTGTDKNQNQSVDKEKTKDRCVFNQPFLLAEHGPTKVENHQPPKELSFFYFRLFWD